MSALCELCISWLYFQDPKENTAGFIPAFLPQLLCFVLDCHLCAVDCLDIFLIFPTILILFLSCSQINVCCRYGTPIYRTAAKEKGEIKIKLSNSTLFSFTASIILQTSTILSVDVIFMQTLLFIAKVCLNLRYIQYTIIKRVI